VERELAVTNNKSAEAFFLLGQIQAEQKKYDEAIKSMDKGLDLAPQAADMRVVYGEILEKAGKDKRAIAQFTEALRFLPGDEGAIAGLKRLGAPVPAPTGSPHGQ
jgi:predicted Zn-dependent protease